MSADISGDTITISMERFREFEALAEIANKYTNKKNKYKREAYNKNKDEINAKRREQYKLKKKEAEVTAQKNETVV